MGEITGYVSFTAWLTSLGPLESGSIGYFRGTKGLRQLVLCPWLPLGFGNWEALKEMKWQKRSEFMRFI